MDADFVPRGWKKDRLSGPGPAVGASMVEFTRKSVEWKWYNGSTMSSIVETRDKSRRVGVLGEAEVTHEADKDTISFYVGLTRLQ